MNIYHTILSVGILAVTIWFLSDSYKRRGVFGIGACFGEIGMILLGFILLPITKLGIFGYYFGWSLDKTLRIHKLCGWLSIWCIFLHFLIIVVKSQSINIYK